MAITLTGHPNCKTMFKWKAKSNTAAPKVEAELSESDGSQANESDVDKLIEQGKKFLESGDAKAAIRNLNTAIEIKPISVTAATALMERSKAKKLLGDNRGSDNDWTKAGEVLQMMDEGFAAYEQGGHDYDDGNYKQAIKNYNKAIESISLSQIYYDRGIAKIQVGDDRGAIEDFDNSIMLCASNASDAYYWRGKIKYRKLGDKVGALDDFNKAIELKPDQGDYYESRAALQDDYDALQDLNKAVELDPSDATKYLLRGMSKAKMEDRRGAIQDISTALNLEGKIPTGMLASAYALRGEIRMILREYKDAVTDFDNVINLNPSDGEAFYARGCAKAELGRIEDGDLDIQKARELGFIEEE